MCESSSSSGNRSKGTEGVSRFLAANSSAAQAVAAQWRAWRADRSEKSLHARRNFGQTLRRRTAHRNAIGRPNRRFGQPLSGSAPPDFASGEVRRGELVANSNPITYFFTSEIIKSFNNKRDIPSEAACGGLRGVGSSPGSDPGFGIDADAPQRSGGDSGRR